MALLSFLGPELLDRVPGDVRPLDELAAHADVPSEMGVYLLLAASQRFTYPRGASPVFYIGMTRSLRARLNTHVRFTRQARSRRALELYYPRYEYAAAFGARYAYMVTTPGEGPRELEAETLGRFGRRFGSFPVANGAGSWRWIVG